MLEQILTQLNSTEVVLEKGEVLFSQGNGVASFYYVKAGKIKLIRNTIEGGELLIHVALPGEVFAEASLFSSEYHCSAITVIKSNILSYKKHEFLQHLEQNPSIMRQLLKTFSQQVRNLRAINEIKNIHSAKDRILAFIKNEMDEHKELALDMPLKDIAYKIGLAHETFYRELKKLESDNILVRNSSFLKLL